MARQTSSEELRSANANKGALENQGQNFLCMALFLEVFYYLKEKTKLNVNSHSQITAAKHCETLLRYLGIRLAQQLQQVWVIYNAAGFNVQK